MLLLLIGDSLTRDWLRKILLVLRLNTLLSLALHTGDVIVDRVSQGARSTTNPLLGHGAGTLDACPCICGANRLRLSNDLPMFVHKVWCEIVEVFK